MNKYNYIVPSDKKINKYEVIIDEEKLTILKEKIIEECGYIQRIDEDTTELPEVDNIHIRNYQEKVISMVNPKEAFYYNDKSVYHVTYLKYIDPYLVILIDNLLNGNLSSLKEIYDSENQPKYSYSEYLLKRIESLEEKVSDLLSINNKEEVKYTLNLIKKLELLRKYNINQKSPIIYYEDVKNCIEIKLIDQIDKIETEKVLNFFEEDKPNEIVIEKQELRKGEIK